MKSLEHKLSKELPVKWFLLGMVPILNLYYIWIIAQLLSGHKKSEGHLEHENRIVSPIKWFIIILLPLPSIITLILTLSIFGGLIFYLNLLFTIFISTFVLWKMSDLISGHEKGSSDYNTIKHSNNLDQTLSWIVYGIVPGLNFYFLWRLSVVITEHSIISSRREELEEPQKPNN